MAEYRLSANVISRRNGSSSVASAAYRSGTCLEDERTGLVHDYTRKQGVLHSEILAPDNTPQWMLDRAALWNAVEKIERRKDAQLSREIQLSLPHELTRDQQRELISDFVNSQFVDRGMIADVSIHAPNKKGDERNFHAHVMLTTRTLTADGFDQKNRDWNNKVLLQTWREEWAQHQNNALERYGHDARVDHRSYDEQGIDREPQQHLGHAAANMARRGKPSRIANENKAIAKRNAARAMDYAQAAQLAGDMANKTLSAQWAEKKQAEQDKQTSVDLARLEKKHQLERDALEKSFKQDEAKNTIRAELKATQDRLQAKGAQKLARDVFQKTAQDKENLIQLEKVAKKINRDEKNKRDALAAEQKKQRDAVRQQQTQKQENLKAEQSKKQSRNNQGRGGDVQGGRDRKKDKPFPQPPPPRHAQAIAQQWAEKSGFRAKEIAKQVEQRRIDTTRLDRDWNKPDQPTKAQTWEQKKAQMQHKLAKDPLASKAGRSADNDNQRSFTRGNGSKKTQSPTQELDKANRKQDKSLRPTQENKAAKTDTPNQDTSNQWNQREGNDEAEQYRVEWEQKKAGAQHRNKLRVAGAQERARQRRGPSR